MSVARHELVWAAVGNTVIALGAGTLSAAAFVPSLPVVPENFAVRTVVIAVGFAAFFWGYHISQAGTYRDSDEPLLNVFLPGSDSTKGMTSGNVGLFKLVRGGFVMAGALSLGGGVRLFALLIDSGDLMLGGFAGVATAIGYICAHIGINWRLL